MVSKTRVMLTTKTSGEHNRPFSGGLHLLVQRDVVPRQLHTRRTHPSPRFSRNTHKDNNRNNGAKDIMNNDHQASTNYREAFQLFDKRGNGRVDRGALGDLLRACGQNPTLAEITDLERGVGADFDFDTFSKILNRPGGFREPFDIEEYIRGFQVFDKDRSGFVGKGQIKYILTNLGEKMSEEEVDELFKSTIDASNDEVDYREFVKTIAEN
ncbi:myosin II light chain [Didymella glomerata]|uniref:Calmodulin n=1 Tax=Didymella glomerata TaxID=749621 RepID=A0A9W8WV68_9PLEO|nr:myosin II light chain [Didymella glomerata]